MKVEISSKYLRQIVRGLERLLNEEGVKEGRGDIAWGILSTACSDANPKELRKALYDISREEKKET